MKQPQPSAAPVIDLGEPITHILPNGLTLLIVENNRLPQVSIRLSFDEQPTLEGDKKGVFELISLLAGNGSTTISKDDFNEEIDYLAADISIMPNGVMGRTLSKYFGRVLELIADAALHPHFSEEELAKEKARLIQSIRANDNNAEAIMKRVGKALCYTLLHPYGEYTTEEKIAAITLEDIKEQYHKHFVPNNAYLVIAGEVQAKEVIALVTEYFGKWEAVTITHKPLYEPINVLTTQIDLIDLPTAVQSEVRVTNLIELSMKDKDYFALLVTNSILGGDFGSYINMNLREANGYTYGASSYFKTDKWTKGVFNIKTSVGNAVTAPAVIETLKEVKRIRTEFVSEEKLAQAKAQYLGQFVLATERPQTIANYAINIKARQLSPYFYKNYIANINAVTKEDVQRVAEKYFQLNQMRIIVVGKKDEVLKDLESVTFEGEKLPVYLFDSYANQL